MGVSLVHALSVRLCCSAADVLSAGRGELSSTSCGGAARAAEEFDN